MAAAPTPPLTDTAPTKGLSDRARRVVLALARAALPAGKTLPAGGEETAARFASWVLDANELELGALEALLWSAELAAIPYAGRPLSALPVEKARAFLESWEASSSPLRRAHLRGVLTPIKSAHFDDDRMFARAGCPRPPATLLPRLDEPARWMQQVMNGKQVEEDLDLECEVVVVGTGAGGAACAYELAKRGRAVLLLEEGDYHRRSTFDGRARGMSKKLYRDKGLTMSIGNVGIPIWAGRAVGGSTLINSGTCYRAPDRVLDKWSRELGLPLTPDVMAPYYDRVAAMLQVTAADRAHLGGVARVIAKGADKLGWSHHPLDRNAPDCDGQGVCCFGCPTGAKRSTDVSWIPAALERGAQLVTAAKVEGIDVVAGVARGVRGTLGSGRAIRVRARAVVIAGGALMTPLLLDRAGVCRGLPVGKNLSIHPASKVMALFSEPIDMATGIPQGYCVDELSGEGIMFEGASTPLDVTALAIPWVGRKYTDVMERFRDLATFGFMIEDTSRGEVRPGPRGSPFIRYDLNDHDVRRMQRAMALLCELFLEAGAERVMPFLPGAPEVWTVDGARAITRQNVRAGDLEVTAYHPLGTCRMGTDPRTSVVGPDHETHEVESLYVVDGGAVPTPLGVNPQMTIMAMALRAAEGLDARLG